MSDTQAKSKKIPTRQGVVVSDKRDKTRTVEVMFGAKHSKYGKYMQRTSKYQVHDADNQSHEGDEVEIQFCKPISKTKSWTLVRVLKKAPGSEVVTQAAEDVIASTQTPA